MQDLLQILAHNPSDPVDRGLLQLGDEEDDPPPTFDPEDPSNAHIMAAVHREEETTPAVCQKMPVSTPVTENGKESDKETEEEMQL